jgi:hypothetical protein
MNVRYLQALHLGLTNFEIAHKKLLNDPENQELKKSEEVAFQDMMAIIKD